MDKWCETLVWRSDIAKWLTEPHNHKQDILIKWKDGSITKQPTGSLHYCNIEAVKQVSAIAELPTGEIGEEFDFTTAVELMKDGNLCVCNTSLRAYKIDKNRNWVRYVLHTDLYEYEDSFCISEILGKWRLA